MEKHIKRYFLGYLKLILSEIIYYALIIFLILLFPSFFSNAVTVSFMEEVKRVISLGVLLLPPIIFLLLAILYEVKFKIKKNEDKERESFIAQIRMATFIAFLGFQGFLFLISGQN